MKIFSHEEIINRKAAAEGKKAIGEFIDDKSLTDEAELDKRFIEVMTAIVNEQEINTNAFIR